ncbi:MAG: hypothetical protein GWN99_19090 [Gemmatimonadetes bacterium]|uniref:Glycosyltransferase RgtA/B/C/D-like domain-containing protein n=1 Tax=Candidatus Kutchimonas denitrificans TaxID=3056748 RepID=A0AAE5C7S3_9BACT|nr:hypothetical protein [Gemmatimonadota bacterium]NIR73771.1 hypothetical protein [Candidatus Kutchimonas denitrificans]NIS03135.1 hypothetical protein [Gemmatimonadota bacterium]NIT69036.1 hypothetical protein [Gemmatimonadota bacterium]NIU54127.1 hypothetical protein [Gemmatimonadota bacterium]
MVGGRMMPAVLVRRLLEGLTVVLALLTFLPWATWLGEARPEEVTAYRASVKGWLLWLAVVVPVVVVLTLLRGRTVGRWLERGRRRLTEVSGPNLALACAGLLACVAALFSWLLFARNPHLVDSIAQLFQARIFTAGSVSAPAPERPEFFAASHLLVHEGRWFAQYPPGHSALLALGLAVGLPWVINPIFAGGTVLLVYGAARRLLDEGTARLAALLYLLAPFALFMSASYMNHITTGFFLALALYAALRAAEDESPAWPLAAGLALAFAATIRPLESLAWTGILGFFVLARRGYRAAALSATACLFGITPLLAFNALTSGHPLRFGYTLLWGRGHSLGFHTDPWGEPFTPLVSFANTALDFQRLDVFLFNWPFPSLIFVLAALWFGARDERWRRPLAWLAALLLAAPAAYFFYWHRDNYLGPRFLFASLVPALILTAAGIAYVDRIAGRWRPAFRLLFVAVVIHAVAFELPANAGFIAGLEPEMNLHPEEQLERAGVDEAVVFVKVGWGSRLIGRLWGWRVPASEVERSYRLIDGCRLQRAIDAADSLAAQGVDSPRVVRGLRQQLADWRADSLPVVRALLPDPSVRVDTTRTLETRCLEEATFDRTGFTHYETLVWRNDPWLARGTIYARSLDPDRNLELLSLYPDRDAYLYAPTTLERTAVPQLFRLPIARPAGMPDKGAGGDR